MNKKTIVETKLRACPFCGGIEFARGLSSTMCVNCLAVGPLRKSSLERAALKPSAATLWNTRADDVLLKRCDTALETADGIMGGEADNPEEAAWITEVEQIRGEIAERVK